MMTNQKALLALAKLGAQARIVELKKEIANLEKIGREAFANTGRPPRSAASRKAMSVRMKAYWAAKRAGNKKAPTRSKA